MSSQVLVSLLVSVVFWNIVQVLSSDDNGSVHLGGYNGTGQNLSSDGNSTGEWTFLVNVVGFNGSLWGLESQSNILNPSLGSLGDLGLWVGEDVRLLELVCGPGGVYRGITYLLERSFGLNRQFSSHDELSVLKNFRN